ncbi:Carboxyl-terminal protease, partial [hydrothermal vent metagenome]
MRLPVLTKPVSIKSCFVTGLVALMLSSAPIAALAQESTPEQNSTSPARSSEEVYSQLKLFGDVFDRVRKEYVDVPDEKALIQAAIEGMLSSLDPHSGYLSPKNYDAVRQDTSGKFGGLGIELTMQEGVVKVVSPIPDTPASRAGLLANDYIVKLDGAPVMGMSMDDAISRMRGIVGTNITVTVVREGVGDPFDVTLKRDFIPLRAVRWFVDKDIGVMRLDQFSEQAFSGIKDAINGI